MEVLNIPTTTTATTTTTTAPSEYSSNNNNNSSGFSALGSSFPSMPLLPFHKSVMTAAVTTNTSDSYQADLLKCGSCLAEFLLSDIVVFIQHKTKSCKQQTDSAGFTAGTALVSHKPQ